MDLGLVRFEQLGDDMAYHKDDKIIDLLSLKAQRHKIFADIGCGTSKHIFELANENTYIVLVEKQEAHLLSQHLDYAKRARIPNICARMLFSDRLPFSNGLFDRIEAHYVLTTYSRITNIKKFMSELLRILDDKGLLIISGEFLLDDHPLLKESLSDVIGTLEGYHTQFIRTPMSEYGAEAPDQNVTLLISKKRKVIAEELKRLERKIGAEKARYLDIWHEFEISWSQTLEISENEKRGIKRLLENLFGLISSSYEKVLPLGSFAGQLHRIGEKYLIYINKYRGGEVVIELSRKDYKVICTLRKKSSP